MKKLLLLAWMMVLSIIAMAQTIMVIDKDGNRVPYDPAKVSSVDFQVSPPGFTVNHEVGSDLYLFDKVQSVKGLPDYLFVDPKVVHVSLASTEGSEAIFAAKVKTNVEYEVETSAPWIKVARKEADRLVCNVLQHEGNDRRGYVALASKDGLLTDTIKVSIDDEFYVLKCITPVQSITTVGTAQFTLIEIVNGALRPAAGKTISFSAENGTCSVKEAVTDAQGTVRVDFIPNSESIDRGSVQASFLGRFNGISMMYTSTALFAVEVFELKCVPKQYFWKDEAVTVEFQLMKYDKGTRKPVRATDINFTCENGTLNAQSKQTDEEGKVSVDFAPDKNFKTGTVTARCKIQLTGGGYWYGEATTEVIKGEEYMLEALTPYVNLCGDNLGEIPVQFRLLMHDFEKDEWEPCFDKLVEFNVENGTLSNMLDFTEIDGVTTITFKPDQNFVEGSVTAFCNINLPDGNEWHGEAVTKFKTDLYKIKKNAPFSEAVDYYIGMPWDCKYELLKKEGDDYVPCPYQYIRFEATNGSCTPDYALTDAEGKILTTYTMDDDKDNGSLEASFDFTDNEGNVCMGSVMTNFFLNKYRLECLTPEVEIMQGGMAEIRFQLLEYKKGNWEPCPDKTIYFKAENGICTPEWRTTNAEGIAIVGFTPTDIDATLGTVQGDCTIILDPKTGLDWRSSAVALITIIKKYSLECLTPEVEIKKGETAEIRFRELKNENGEWVPAQSGVINFTAENGTSKPEWTSVNEEGIALATFIPAADATEGTLTAFFSVNVNDVVKLKWAATAHITIIDDGGSSDPCDTGDADLNKADLMDNSYVIKNKTTGEEQVRNYDPTWSEWRKEGKDFIMFFLEDADAEGMTLGDAWGNLPWNMVNVVKALTGQSFENSPGGKFGWGVYTDDCHFNTFFGAHTGESGMVSESNLKPESKILLRKPCNTKKEASAKMRRAPGEEEEYTGEYELLFYLVFENEEGDEYEVYGKGTMKMHVPTITSFVARTEKDWVKVGESTKVTLEQYYEEGATWDWNDVQLVGQSTDYSKARNGEDEGFFSWDAASQTLTSLKSNDNKDVWVYLGLKSKPSVKAPLQVATGEGWKYTMIKPSQEVHTYTGYGYMSFSFDFAPKASEDEKFDYNSLEIDPETNPNGYFSIPMTYAAQGWPLYVNSDTPAGEYTVRFWIKNNHAVSCTVKVIAYPEE